MHWTCEIVPTFYCNCNGSQEIRKQSGACFVGHPVPIYILFCIFSTQLCNEGGPREENWLFKIQLLIILALMPFSEPKCFKNENS